MPLFIKRQLSKRAMRKAKAKEHRIIHFDEEKKEFRKVRSKPIVGDEGLYWPRDTYSGEIKTERTWGDRGRRKTARRDQWGQHVQTKSLEKTFDEEGRITRKTLEKHDVGKARKKRKTIEWEYVP